MGYIITSITNECLPCEIGTYSDTDNSDSCITCPEGYKTLQEGSDHRSDCTGRICFQKLI